jgi:hypothetical protein
MTDAEELSQTVNLNYFGKRFHIRWYKWSI